MNQITIEILFAIFFLEVSVDFITGIIASWKEGRLKSRICSDGMFRSIGEVIVLLVFMVLAELLPALSGILGTFMLGFIFKEGLSICENLERLDVWIPQTIKQGLEVSKNKIDKGE